MGVPRWFSAERAESEHFARAVDDPATPPPDSELTPELALVGALRELGAAGSPSIETRRRIREDIVGRFADADPADDETPAGGKHPMLVRALVAAAAVLLALGGLGLLLSKDALPGDALYTIKRAGEATALGLTFDQQGKAEKHLEYATTRITELTELARADRDGADYVTGLTDFDADVRAGVAQLTTLATTSGGGEQQLSGLRDWARQQAGKLAAEQASIPADARREFSAARSLLTEIQTRVTALTERLSCYRITSGSSDALGAVPAEGGCEQAANPLPLIPRSTVPTTENSPAPDTGKPELTARTGTGPSLTVDPSAGPTPALPPVSGLPVPPPVFGSPVPPPTGPRLPSAPPAPPRPPLVSIPPLIPGLPPIVIP